MFNKFLQFTTVLLVLKSIFIEANIFLECEDPETFNTFVASQTDCSRYIFCDGDDSFEGECLDDNYFNEKEGNCDDPDAVVCAIETDIEDIEPNEGVVISGTSIDNGLFNINFVTDVPEIQILVNNNVNEINSNNELSSVNNENVNTVFTNSNKQSSGGILSTTSNSLLNNGFNHQAPNVIISSLAVNSNNVPNIISSNFAQFLSNSAGLIGQSGNSLGNTIENTPKEIPQCPLLYGLSNMFNIANPDSCATYYTCYNGIAIPMMCQRHMYFNPDTGKCERSENVNCPLIRPVRLQCRQGVYDFIPHPRNCEYYYFCSNGFLMIFQCPFHFTWHYERRTCVHHTRAKCFSQGL
ncbi:myb-like protein D [Teleopsis dalmanni]|uniref:myb-like protein D n=1 Tax=Teleopsis dalmanni TaxID=139649 RepID=UPI0018CD9B12|nr:myb-like protein D [Teleopsis dalmanni]